MAAALGQARALGGRTAVIGRTVPSGDGDVAVTGKAGRTDVGDITHRVLDVDFHSVRSHCDCSE